MMSELTRKGGKWLGAARNWIIWNIPRGDSLTWGSGETVTLTVRQLEDLAEATAESLAQDLKECREELYYYPPTEPFAGDGVTWEQRAKELQEQLARAVDAGRTLAMHYTDNMSGFVDEYRSEFEESIEALQSYQEREDG